MFVLGYSVPFLDAVRTILTVAAPGMPEGYWWVTAFVLFVLAAAAAIDAFTGLVPDSLIVLGLFAVTGTQGFVASKEIAARHLGQAFAAGLLIWSINFLWDYKFRREALGMGDAKWTMVAVACFGVVPSLFAWGAGALLAISFIGVARLLSYRVTRVTFAPFLFVGLTLGLYWVRFGVLPATL